MHQKRRSLLDHNFRIRIILPFVAPSKNNVLSFLRSVVIKIASPMRRFRSNSNHFTVRGSIGKNILSFSIFFNRYERFRGKNVNGAREK